MSDFLDGFSKKFSEKAETAKKKTGDFIAVQGLKSQKHQAQTDITENLTEIGKAVFRKYKDGEEVPDDVKSFCEEITKKREEIGKLNKEIDEYGDDGQ